MKEQMFCLACISWEPVVNGGHMIYLPSYEGEPAEIDWCTGPFTYFEPPEEQDGWDVDYTEPTPDELEYIDQDADNFMEEVN